MSLERELLEQFVAVHPADAAVTVSALSKRDQASIFTTLPPAAAGELLRHLPSLPAALTLAELPVDGAAAIISAARRDVAISVLRATEVDRRAAVLASLPKKDQTTMSGLLQFAEDTAGALMDPEVLTAHRDTTVEKALELVQREAERALYYLYVVGTDQRLVGVVSIRELMCAPADAGVLSICSRTVDAISASATWETVLQHPAWQNVHALPVVVSGRRFAGAIRYETIRRLERAHAVESLADPSQETVSAIGELLGLGLRGLFQAGGSGRGPRDAVETQRLLDSGDGQ